ncbi:hypothetical protein L208DRAFT_1382971 [Tricholoma matsutake]|nr:hypothetical protein L208DRAFT_1382971 [Tricholoma matsutake 945]
MTQPPYIAAFAATLLTDQPPPNQSQEVTTGWNQNPDYCILPKAVFFCVNISQISRHSKFLTAILSIPPLVTDPQASEANPIVLEGIEKEAFKDFLRWLNHLDWQPPPQDEKVLVNILHMCHMWMVQDGIAFAVHQLEALLLQPSQMLQLAHQFSLAKWVAPSLHTLIEQPVTEITHEDADQLGTRVLLVITKAHAVLKNECRLLTAFPLQAASNLGLLLVH